MNQTPITEDEVTRMGEYLRANKITISGTTDDERTLTLTPFGYGR